MTSKSKRRSRSSHGSRRRPSRAQLDIQFEPGDTLAVRAHKSLPGHGLSYTAMTVVSDDVGRGGQLGGWDVYDGVTPDGREVSFYGFSVDRMVKRAGRPRTLSR